MFHSTRYCITFAFFFAALVLNCGTAGAIRELGGDEPVKDGPWPDGAVDVANLKSRFCYSTGDGGYDEFLYRGDTPAFQQALDAFAKVRAPALELFVHDGPYLHWIVKNRKEDGHIDWAYTLQDPEVWHSIYNNPQSRYSHEGRQPSPPPRIDVYVGAPGIDWTQVKVPDGITVKDQRLAAAKKMPPGTGVFRGVIYNMADGKTIAGATIEAQRYADKEGWQPVMNVSTDATGAFKIESLPLLPERQDYRIVASAKGFASRVLCSEAIKPDTFRRIDGELSAEVAVKGTVTDEQDAPLPNIRVRLDIPLGIDGSAYELPRAMEAHTDAAGHFSFAGAPTGSAQFECRGAGHTQINPHTFHHLESWHKFGPNGGDPSLTGDVPVDLRMAVPGKIHCKVASADATPIDDTVNVTIADAEGGFMGGRYSSKYQRSASIGQIGLVDFTDLRPGRYFVVVGYWVDHFPDAQIVTVNAGKTTEVQLVAKMPKKRAPEPPPKPVPPPRPPTTDDKF